MDDLLANLPDGIKSLSITSGSMKLRANRHVPFGTFKNLRSVEFSSCYRLDINFFAELAALFKEEKILLDVLDIRKCQDINSEECTEEVVKVLFRDAGVLQT